MNHAYLETLRAVLSVPTAPFHEQMVVARVHEWASQRGLEFATDSAGNVLVHYRGAQPRKQAQWVLAAHMDHPGFVVRQVRGRRVQADFIGGVGSEYFPGSAVRFFADEAGTAARVKIYRTAEDSGFPQVTLELDSPARLPAGTIGMWDLPAMRIRGRRLASRACDDIVGVAAVLCALDELRQRKAAVNVTGLLTRGEEAGFIGAMAACEERTLGKSSLIVTIETSKAQPAARLGDGVVVRVGDRTRTFDPGLTAHLSAVAERLAKEDGDFRFTRALMPGGTCESTAFMAWGYRTAATCIPLGNYHNQGKGNKIQAEQVDMGDFESLVKLLVGVAGGAQAAADVDAGLHKRLRDLLASRKRYLRP